MGAALIFLASFTALSGLQVMASRLLDSRKTLTLGIGLILGVSYEPIMLLLNENSPDVLNNFLLSGVSLGVVSAVILSAVFQIKNHTRDQRSFDPVQSSMSDVVLFLEQQGARWGARPEIIGRAEYAAWQAFEVLTEYGLIDAQNDNDDKIHIKTLFNEFTFTVILSYRGSLLTLATECPSHEKMLNDEQAVMQMAGYLLYRLADKVRTRYDGNHCELHLIFND
jgi:xanthine permease XanP